MNIEYYNEVLTGQQSMEKNKNQYIILTVNIILIKYLIQRLTIKKRYLNILYCFSDVSESGINRTNIGLALVTILQPTVSVVNLRAQTHTQTLKCTICSTG